MSIKQTAEVLNSAENVTKIKHRTCDTHNMEQDLINNHLITKMRLYNTLTLVLKSETRIH